MEDIRSIEDKTKEELDQVNRFYFFVFILSQVFSCLLVGTALRYRLFVRTTYRCGSNINCYCPEIVSNLLQMGI
jgi:hypothetical protein